MNLCKTFKILILLFCPDYLRIFLLDFCALETLDIYYIQDVCKKKRYKNLSWMN